MNHPLDKRSLLDVASRVLGLYQLTMFWTDLSTYLNMTQRLYEPLHESPNAALILAVSRAIAGLFLLFGASFIVNLVYGDAPQPPADNRVADESRAARAEQP